MFKAKYNFQRRIWYKSTFMNMFTYLNSMPSWNLKETEFWKDYCMVFVLKLGFQLQWMKEKELWNLEKIMKNKKSTDQ